MQLSNVYQCMTSISQSLMQCYYHPCSIDLLKSLPKIDTHVHLPGTISPATAWMLGVRNGLIFWNGGQWVSNHLSNTNPHTTYFDIFTNLESVIYERNPNLSWLQYQIHKQDFLSFDRIMATVQGHRHPPGGIQTGEDLLFVLDEYLQQCLHDGIIYTEVQQNIRIAYAIFPNMSPESSRMRLYELLHYASQRFASKGVIIKFLNCFNKTSNSFLQETSRDRAKEASLWLQEVERIYPGLFVGLQSAGAESCSSADPCNLIEGYRSAYELGFGCEAHAGEGIGFHYLKNTLNTLPLTRIAHGFQAVEDRNTVDLIVEKQITLVMAPLINFSLGIFLHRYRDGQKIAKYPVLYLDHHPLFSLMRKDFVSITLSSDNPAMGGRSLLDTIFALTGVQSIVPVSDQFQPLSFGEIVQLVCKGIVSSFSSEETKVCLLRRVLSFLQTIPTSSSPIPCYHSK